MGNEFSTQQLLMIGLPPTANRVFKRDILNFLRSDFGNHGDLTKATPEDLIVLTRDYMASESFLKFRPQLGPCPTTGKLLEEPELHRQLLKIVTKWIEKERVEKLAMNPAVAAAEAVRAASMTSNSHVRSSGSAPSELQGISNPPAPHGVSMPSAPHGVSVPSAPPAPHGISIPSMPSAPSAPPAPRGDANDLPPAYSEPAANPDLRATVAENAADLAPTSHPPPVGGKHTYDIPRRSREPTSSSPTPEVLTRSSPPPPPTTNTAPGQANDISPAEAAVAAPPFPPPSAANHHDHSRNERLLQLVHQISEYISQCEEHSMQMTRDASSSERERQAAQVRAMTFANLRIDVGSRVEAFLNQDPGSGSPGGKQQAGQGQVTNYCLWS